MLLLRLPDLAGQLRGVETGDGAITPGRPAGWPCAVDIVADGRHLAQAGDNHSSLTHNCLALRAQTALLYRPSERPHVYSDGKNVAADGKKPLSAGKPAAEAGIGAHGRGLTVVGCDVIDSQLNGGDFFQLLHREFRDRTLLPEPLPAEQYPESRRPNRLGMKIRFFTSAWFSQLFGNNFFNLLFNV